MRKHLSAWVLCAVLSPVFAWGQTAGYNPPAYPNLSPPMFVQCNKLWVVGRQPWGTGSVVNFNTYTGLGVAPTLPGQTPNWATFNVTDFGLPADTVAIFVAGIDIITHGQNAEIADLKITFQVPGFGANPGTDYIVQDIATDTNDGARHTAAFWVPVQNGQFQMAWEGSNTASGTYPSWSSYGLSLGINAFCE